MCSSFGFMVRESSVAGAAAALSAANIVLSLIAAGLWVLLLIALFGAKSAETVSFDGLG